MSGTSLGKAAEVLVGDRGYAGSCLRIAEKLPEYFDANDLGTMRRDLLEDVLYVAVEAEEVVGFSTVRDKGEKVAEISWLAVDPGRRSGGIGRALAGRVEEDLAAGGVELLMVKTLAADADYPPYQATRRFYERVGFLHLETVNPYPGWGSDPAAIYVKNIDGLGGRMQPEKVNIEQKFASFDEHWSPKIAGELNGQHVKLSKMLGEFVWHHHDEEDELFLVVKGRFRMEFRDRSEWIEEGEFIVVPRGIEHRPVAEEEAHVMLFEPASTLNTGNVRGERTVEELDRI